MSSKSKVTTIRKTNSRGRWQKGASGNPAGRPLGSRNKSTLWVEEQLNNAREAITGKAIERAKAGDIAAIRLCMDRMCPVPRDRPIQFDLPGATDSQGIAADFSVLLAGLRAGQLTPAEAESIARVLETMARVMNLEDLACRVEALEQLQSTSADPQTPTGSSEDH
jgi:hypothetical protein